MTPSATSDVVVALPWRRRLVVLAWALLLGAWTLVLRRLPRAILERVKRMRHQQKEGGSMTRTRHGGAPPPAMKGDEACRHSFMKIKGVKLHCVEAGDPDAPPLLLLHGFPDGWRGWRAQMAMLSARGYRAVALELKGFGDSERAAMRTSYRPPIVLDELRAALVALTDGSRHRTVTLVAHDLGALLGWFLLHDSPELIEKFVCVSTPHPNVYWESLNPKATLNLSWMYSIQIPWLAENEALRDDMQLLEKTCPHLKSNPALLDIYRYAFSRHDDWTGPLNYFRNLIFWRIKENCDMINVPTLLITGNNDPQISLESIVRSSEWCTNALVKIVDGVGHFPHQESPEAFNQLLVKFLNCKKETIPNGKTIEELDSGVTGLAKGLVGRFLGATQIFS